MIEWKRNEQVHPEYDEAILKSERTNYELIIMAEEEAKEKGKVEGAAEKTGEVVGKGLKKGWGAVKGVGKGLKEGVTKKEEEK
jgi:hypothetical protein